MHLSFANIKFRKFLMLAKFNGRENLCSRKLMSAKINVLKVVNYFWEYWRQNDGFSEHFGKFWYFGHFGLFDIAITPKKYV